MLKKSTLLSVSIFFLLFVSSSDSYADHKKNPNAGHGSDKGGNSNEFQVHLAGAFVFQPPVVVVESSPNGTTLRSSTNVTMTRPDDNGLLEETWDAVFESCPVLRGVQVDEIFVPAADWRININTQEVQDIHLIFNDIRFDSPTYEPPAEINLQLIADLDFLNEELPISIALERFAFWGSTQNGIHPRERCGLDVMPFLPFLDPPMLTICAEGDPCPPAP